MWCVQDASPARGELTWVLLGKDSKFYHDFPPVPFVAHCKWLEAWYIGRHPQPISWTKCTCSRVRDACIEQLRNAPCIISPGSEQIPAKQSWMDYLEARLKTQLFRKM